MRRRAAAVGTALVAASLAIATRPFAAHAAAVVFTPIADASVSSSQATKNFGRTSALDVRLASTSTLRTYVTFSVSGLAGTVSGVRLRLYASDGSADGGTVARTSTSWSESTITWKNAPA